MFPSRVQKRRKSARRGVQVLEAIIGLPVIVIITMALFEFGTISTVQHAVGHAAVESARERAKYATDAEIETIVETILGPHLQPGFDISTDAGVRIIIDDGNSVTSIGDASLGGLPAAAVTPPEVEVTIRFSMAVAPVPNLLKSFCIDIQDRNNDGQVDYYEVSSLARFE